MPNKVFVGDEPCGAIWIDKNVIIKMARKCQ
jgi:hypothetical protein